jgi:hypothetical protein
VTGRRTRRSWGRVLIRLLALVGTVLILAAASSSASPAATPGSPSPEPSSTPASGTTLDPEPGAAARPLVFAYYYIWYTPTSWNRAKTDLPTLGAYDSADRAVIAQHMAWAKQAGIDALIVSWKHQPRLDGPLQTVVEEAAKAGLKLVLLYQGLDFNRQAITDATVASDINWFMDTYGTSPVFNVFGRPAVVWSGTWGYTDTQIARVRAQIRAPDRILLLGSERSGASYAARAALFDGDAYYWSSPDPLKTPGYQSRLQTIANAVRADSGIWIAPAAPGFDARLVGGTSTVLRRDGATFRAAWAGAVRTKPDAIGIISWNEFSENSAIEPSKTYGDAYLRLAGELVAGLVSTGSGPSPSPAQPSFAPAPSTAPVPGGAAPIPPAPAATNSLGIWIGLALAAGILVVGSMLRRRAQS